MGYDFSEDSHNSCYYLRSTLITKSPQMTYNYYHDHDIGELLSIHDCVIEVISSYKCHYHISCYSLHSFHKNKIRDIHITCNTNRYYSHIVISSHKQTLSAENVSAIPSAQFITSLYVNYE